MLDRRRKFLSWVEPLVYMLVGAGVGLLVTLVFLALYGQHAA